MPYKRQVVVKVGSSDFPIKLKNENEESGLFVDEESDRFLFHRFTTLSGHKSNPIDDPKFNSARTPTKPIENLFILNVLANPHLPVLAIRVAVALYYLLSERDEGDIFITTSRKLNYDERGEDGFVYLNRDNEGWLINEDNRLMELLFNQFGLEMTMKQLNNALNVLHQFNYITVTSITPENFYPEDKKKWYSIMKKRKDNKKLKEYRACLKHIVLSKLMRNKSIINKFLALKEGKEIRKQERLERGY